MDDSVEPLADDLPNVARMYDHLLGGANNGAPDRDATRALAVVFPNIVPTAWANRSFLRHAVEHALSLGIRQFLDLGSGIPTVGNVHEIAARVDPGSRVAYVDSEPVHHSAVLLSDAPNTTVTQADLRDPGSVLAAPGVAGLLDLSRPVALLAVAALHFVADDPGPILANYRRALAPGSLAAISHVSEDYPGHPEFVRAFHDAVLLYGSTSHPAHPRSRREIAAFLETAGFVPNGDGLVDVSHWAPPRADDGPLGLYAVITEPLVGDDGPAASGCP